MASGSESLRLGESTGVMELCTEDFTHYSGTPWLRLCGGDEVIRPKAGKHPNTPEEAILRRSNYGDPYGLHP